MGKTPITRNLDLLIYSQVNDYVKKVTCQLFLKIGSNGFSALGTGVLVKLGKQYYIFTAAHVAEEFDKRIYIRTPKGIFFEIFGDCQYTDYSNMPKIDVAFIIIDDKFAELLLQNEFHFLKEEKILISHSLTKTTNYIIFGYPVRNVIVKKKEGYISTKASLLIVKSADEKLYDFYKFERSFFYIFDFKGKGINLKTEQKSQKLGKQNGMSGCGLWLMDITENNYDEFDIEFFFVGLMTDEPPGKFKCLVGNKINVLISGIASYNGNEVAVRLASLDKQELFLHQREQ